MKGDPRDLDTYADGQDEEPLYECPRCYSEREPDVQEGTYGGVALCPDCGATVDEWLTAEGVKAEQQAQDEARAAEDAFYAAEAKATHEAREAHMAGDECARDEVFYHSRDTSKTVTCCRAGERLQNAAGYYAPWWGPPSETITDGDGEPSDDLPF